MEGRVLYYLSYFEKGTSNEAEEEKGFVVDVEKLDATRKLLEKKYQTNRLQHIGVAERTKQYLIGGVSITMPFGTDVETNRYNPKITLTSESERGLEKIAKMLDLPFDRKKVKRYVWDRLINDFLDVVLWIYNI